jgi:hypothetical protein
VVACVFAYCVSKARETRAAHPSECALDAVGAAVASCVVCVCVCVSILSGKGKGDKEQLTQVSVITCT